LIDQESATIPAMQSYDSALLDALEQPQLPEFMITIVALQEK
jgi:hypothetical protein